MSVECELGVCSARLITRSDDGYVVLLPQQLRFLRVVLPIEGLGEFGGGVGALGAVGEHGDVDDWVAGAGAAAVVGANRKQHRAEADPGQRRFHTSGPSAKPTDPATRRLFRVVRVLSLCLGCSYGFGCEVVAGSVMGFAAETAG